MASAGIAQTLGNINRRDGAKPFSTSDFLPDFERSVSEPVTLPDSKAVSAQVRAVFAPFMKRG